MVSLECSVWLASGHRVVAVGAPGVAAANTFQAQPGALQGPPLAYCPNHIAGAGGAVPAVRPQHRGDGQLVKAHQANQDG